MTFTDPAHPVAFHTTDHVFALLREDVPGERLETELWTADGPVRAPHRSFTSDERQRLEAEQATLGRFHEALVRNPRLIDLARRINPHTPRRGRAVRWGADLYYTGLVTADMAWRDDGDGQKTRVIRVFIDRYEIKADPQLLRQRDKIEELRDNVMSELRDALPARFGDYEVEVLEGPNDEEFAAWKESLRQ